MGFWPSTLVEYAQAVAPVATFTAVGASLYIALRRPTPKLEVQIGLRVIITGGGVPNLDVLTASITNVGPGDAVITNLGWRAGTRWRKRKHAIQMTDYGPGSVPGSKLPCRIAHGEKAEYFFRTVTPEGWLSAIEERGLFAEELDSRERLETLRFVVFTSVGRTMVVKPEKSLLDEIWSRQSREVRSRIRSICVCQVAAT